MAEGGRNPLYTAARRPFANFAHFYHAPKVSNSIHHATKRFMVKTAPKTDTKPPVSLGKPGRKFWSAVLASYVLEDQHHLQLLENAGLLLDRAAAARVKIDTDGVCITNRFGEIVAHPCVNVERQSLALFKATIRELGLDLESPPEVRGHRRPGSRA